MAAIHKNECLSNSMCYYAAESVTEEIMGIYSAIRSIEAEECYQNPSNNLNTVFQRLDYLIAQDICDKRAEEFIYNPGFSSAFDAITSFRSLYPQLPPTG